MLYIYMIQFTSCNPLMNFNRSILERNELKSIQWSSGAVCLSLSLSHIKFKYSTFLHACLKVKCEQGIQKM